LQWAILKEINLGLGLAKDKKCIFGKKISNDLKF
jgi:hypothetical protein